MLAAGFPTPYNVLSSGTGRGLGKLPLGGTLPDGIVSHTIRRAHLHRVLHEEATRRGIPVEYGKRLVNADTTTAGVVARFEDGSQATGDLLIGCDGIHSATRRIMDPAAPAPRYLGLINFGGYTRDLAVPDPPGVWHMVFGKRAFFGYVVDPPGGIVWFANVPHAEVGRAERAVTTVEEWKRQLLDVFAEDSSPATRIVAAGDLELVADNTYDLPSVPTWHRGPMIIVGDAAHAPAPTSGQGASMAIEDAVILARCLRDLPQIPEAFAAYKRLRRERVERIVAHGARGSSDKTPGPVARVLRDLMLPVVFKFLVTEKSLAWLYNHHVDWEAPVEVQAVGT